MRTAVVLWRALTSKEYFSRPLNRCPNPTTGKCIRPQGVEPAIADDDCSIGAGLGGAVRFAPVARQLAGDRGLEQRAAPGVEALAGALQRGLALGDLGEQLVDPRHDPPLLG